MLGYSIDEVLGRSLWEIGPLRDVVSSKAAFQQLRSRGYIRYEHLPLETRYGGRRQVEFVSNVYPENNHQVIQCNIRDITERKAAEAQSKQAHDELVTVVADLRQRDVQVQLLSRLHTLLQASETQAEAFKIIGLVAGELFAGQEGGLAILDSETHILETVARWGQAALLEAAFAQEVCWGMRRGHLHAVADPQSGLLCRHFVQPPHTGTLCVPLMVQGEALGLVCFVGVLDGRGPQPTNQEASAVAVSETIKLSLSNLKLREDLRDQANHDLLTGLFNRRYLEDSLARELYRARRAQAPLSLAMLDLDHLKRYNDALGHEAGDQLLREVGRMLEMHLRASDIACRYGGDEFVVVLPDSSLADTQPRLEQIAVLASRLGGPPLASLTVSIGLAEATRHGFDMRELLRAADQALYAAKQGGRGRLVVSGLE